MLTKSWYFIFGGNIHFPHDDLAECHFLCIQTSAEMAAGQKSSSGHHLLAVVWNGPSGRAKFEQRQDVTKLYHIHENVKLPTEVASALSAYGILETDGLRDALKKIAPCGCHQLTLGEL